MYITRKEVLVMKKQILFVLPALALLAGCSKGSEVESVEQKQAIINEVAEGAAKRAGHDDFEVEFHLDVDGSIKNEENEVKFVDFEVDVEGAFDFPDVLKKGSDIKGINAFLGIETDGKLTNKINGVSAEVDCEGKLADFYFEDGTFYSDVYKTDLSQYLMSMFAPKQELPQKYKINFSELIDPNSALEIKDGFEMDDIDPEILSQIHVYTSDSKYTLQLDTSEINLTDEEGVKHNVKDFYGVDLEGELVVDSDFRLLSVDISGDIDVSKLDEDKKSTGSLSVDLELELDYAKNPSVKKASNKQEYKDFKLNEFFA